MTKLTPEQLRDYEFKIELILRKYRLCQRLTVRLNEDGCMYFNHVQLPATPGEFLRVSEATLELAELLIEIEGCLK